MKVGDVILVSLREFEDAKCDILYVYTPKEIHRLKKLGEIPDSVNVDLEVKTEENDIGIDFANESDSDDEEEMKRKEDFKKDFELNFETI